MWELYGRPPHQPIPSRPCPPQQKSTAVTADGRAARQMPDVISFVLLFSFQMEMAIRSLLDR
ncbi:MAG: hypothetical protein KJ069_26430 [Anaerolineae bacterium]|nr:hypothetical protein [Anaerolineae bacterium]